MENKLLCPICGREMTAIETYPGRGELYCDHCDLTIGGNEAKTPDELTAIVENGQNAKLREVLKSLMVGTEHELCSDKDSWQCAECSMNRSREECAMTDAMHLLGTDCHGNEAK